MKPILSSYAFRTAAVLLAVHTMVMADEIPREWIDSQTGHRVVRLSNDAGSASLYFHQNAYTPDGDEHTHDPHTTRTHDQTLNFLRATQRSWFHAVQWNS